MVSRVPSRATFRILSRVQGCWGRFRGYLKDQDLVSRVILKGQGDVLVTLLTKPLASAAHAKAKPPQINNALVRFCLHVTCYALSERMLRRRREDKNEGYRDTMMLER